MRNGFPTVTLADVAVFNPNGGDSLGGEELVSFVPMAAVSEETGTIERAVTRPFKEVSKGYTRFSEGDVLFARITPCMENGKSTVARGLTNGRGCGSTEFVVIRPGKDLLADFLWLFLRRETFRRGAEEVMTGAVGQKRVPVQYLKSCKIPLPEVSVQRAIVARLREIFGGLNVARSDILRAQRLAKRYRSAILREAFSFEEAYAQVIPLGQLTENYDGRRIPLKESDRACRRGKYPYYGASGQIDTIDDYLFEGDYLLVSEDGANLLARSTPVAFLVSGKFWVNNHAHVLKPCANVRIDYLQWYIESLDLSEYVSGTAQPKLTQRALNSIPVPIPEITKQGAIVSKISDALRATEHVLNDGERSIRLMNRFEQVVVDGAFFPHDGGVVRN